MSHRIDETGKRYGRLTVVRLAEERDPWGKLRWVCRCDCGNEREVAGNDLRFGKVKECAQCVKRGVTTKEEAQEMAKVDPGTILNRSLEQSAAVDRTLGDKLRALVDAYVVARGDDRVTKAIARLTDEEVPPPTADKYALDLFAAVEALPELKALRAPSTPLANPAEPPSTAAIRLVQPPAPTEAKRLREMAAKGRPVLVLGPSGNGGALDKVRSRVGAARYVACSPRSEMKDLAQIWGDIGTRRCCAVIVAPQTVSDAMLAKLTAHGTLPVQGFPAVPVVLASGLGSEALLDALLSAEGEVAA